jgi:RNA polymerase sigma-70 factor (ECF subfamily)
MSFDDVLSLRGSLAGYAYSLAHNWDDAEDLVQATLLRAWVAQDKFEAKHEGSLRAWLRRILHNVYAEPFSHPKSVRAVQLPQRFAHEPYPCAGDQRCELGEFFDALNKLSPEHQSTLLLARAGYSYGEIAASTGVALGTVKSRVNRAEAALRRALALDGVNRA